MYIKRLFSIAAASLGLGIAVIVDQPAAFAHNSCPPLASCRRFCDTVKKIVKSSNPLYKTCVGKDKPTGNCEEVCKVFAQEYPSHEEIRKGVSKKTNCYSPWCVDMREKCQRMRKY